MRFDSRRALQIAVAFGGLVPVGAGLAGVLLGATMTGPGASGANLHSPGLHSPGLDSPDLDSHVRYLSGLLLAIGLAYWASIPRIETHGPRFRLLTLIVAIGGLGRLYGILTHATPSAPMLAGLAMELLVTPLLCLWQSRMAQAAHPAR